MFPLLSLLSSHNALLTSFAAVTHAAEESKAPDHSTAPAGWHPHRSTTHLLLSTPLKTRIPLLQAGTNTTGTMGTMAILKLEAVNMAARVLMVTRRRAPTVSKRAFSFSNPSMLITVEVTPIMPLLPDLRPMPPPSLKWLKSWFRVVVCQMLGGMSS